MTAVAEPQAASAPTATVNVTPPQGAQFEYKSTKTARSKEDAPARPVLVWTDLGAMSAFYGPETSAKIARGEISLNRIFLSFARDKDLSDEAVAEAQVAWRPKAKGAARSGTGRKALSNAMRAAGDKLEESGKIPKGKGLKIVFALVNGIATSKISPDDAVALSELATKAAAA